jgi:hypothetical protein
MKIGEYKQMMKYLTRPGSPKKEKFNPQTLKPGSSLDDVARNMLIEESKARDLSSEEIQYLMTDEHYRNKKPTTVAKQKPFKKAVSTAPVKIDPTPIALTPPVIFDPVAEEQTRRFNKLQREIAEEKLKNQTQGLASLV